MHESKDVMCVTLDGLVMCMISSRTQHAMCHVITAHVCPCSLNPGKKWAPCHHATLMFGCLLAQLQGVAGSRDQGTWCACMRLDLQRGLHLEALREHLIYI